MERRTHRRAAKWQRASAGVGSKTMEGVLGHMRFDEQVSAERVRALGEQIVRQEMAEAKEGAVQTSTPTSS